LGFTHPADAVDRLLFFPVTAYPVVGVVADFHEVSFEEAFRAVVIGNIPRWEHFLGVKLVSAGKSPEKV
jgi:hypothetical protein